MDNIKLTIYRSMHHANLEKAWRNIESRDKKLSPFVYFDYLKYIFAQVSHWSITNFPLIVCAESADGKILMIVPIKKNLLNGGVKMLGDISGCGHTDFLFHPDISKEYIDKCIGLFLDKFGRKFKLRRIVESSPLKSYFDSHAVAGNPFSCVKIKFSDDIDLHIKGLSSSVRQNLRTAYNRMKRDGIDFELKVAMSGSDITLHERQCIMKLYLTRLLSKYKTGNFLYRLYKTIFYKHIKHDTHSLNELNNAFHATISVKGELVGFMSGYTNDCDTVVVPRLAINDAYKFYSPGYYGHKNEAYNVVRA